MDAEEQRARQLADLLDGTRPEADASAEERDLLALRGRAQSLQATASEQAALKERMPQARAARGRVAWRPLLTGAAAVVVLALAALGLNWLISGRGELPPVGQVDEPVPTAIPWSEAQTTADPAFHLPGAALWQGAKLSPDVCVGRAMDDDPEVYERLGIGNLNGNLLGGGQIQSGDFTFDYWLVCDFQLENSSPYLASEISGLGTALKWTYTGAGQDGPIVIYSGIEPYLNESSFREDAYPQQSGMDLRGIELPGLLLADWQAQDTPLRWAVKAVLPDGSIAGAALTFTLMHGEDGFTPVNIELVPLSEAELASPAGVEVSEAPFALLDLDVEYPELASIHALITRHELDVLSGAGWIHRTHEMETDGEVYRREIWTQVGETGNILGEVEQLYRDGGLVSQSVNQTSEAGLSEGYQLLKSLLDAARYGTPAVESRETIDGREVRVFTFPNTLTNGPIYRESIDGLVYTMVTREGVDAGSGAYLFNETQELDENGAVVRFTRGTWSEERKQQAPDEILNLFKNPPQGEVYPNMPLEVHSWACTNPMTPGQPSGGQTGIAGETLASGDFEFEVWLICADRFSRDADIYEPDYSQIDRLGFAVRWTYNGAPLEGHLTPYGGIEPYVEQGYDTTGGQAIAAGLSGSSEFGFNLPMTVTGDWRAADVRLRYVTKVQLPDGRIEGAALVFTLYRSPDGFVIGETVMEPLTEVERSGGSAAEVSEPPFRLIPLGVKYPTLAEIWPLVEQRMADFIGAGGWFHMAWGNGGSETSEGWYQVDERRKVTRLLMAVRDAGGRLTPTMLYQDGYMLEVGGDESGNWPPYDVVMFEYGNLIDDLMIYARSGQPLDRSEETVDGRLVWVYSFHKQFTAANIGGESVRVNRYGLDAQTGELLFQERYEGKDDASLAPVGRTERVVDKRIDAPPEDVLRLMDELGK